MYETKEETKTPSPELSCSSCRQEDWSRKASEQETRVEELSHRMKTSSVEFVLGKTQAKTVLFSLLDIDRVPFTSNSTRIIDTVDSFLESSLQQLQVLRFNYVNGPI